MQAPGIEIRPLVQITGEAEFNEVFFDDVFVPEDHLVGGLHDGWAVANTTLAHERGTAFPFKEQVVHEVYLDELYALAAERGRLDDVEIADALAQSFVELRLLRLAQLADAVPPGCGASSRGRSRASPSSRWTDMTQHLSDTRARRSLRPAMAAAPRQVVARSGCGRRRRRSPVAPPRCSAPSSGSACSACHAKGVRR